MKRALWILLALGSAAEPAAAQAADGPLELELLASDPVPPTQPQQASPPPPSADDLAKAADATADVAAIAAPADSAPEDLARAADVTADIASLPAGAGTKPSSDDIDLSALGLDPASASIDDKLNLYGFADFGFNTQHWSEDRPYLDRVRSFMFGNLNLYMAKSLTPKIRSLAEVRFSFLPNAQKNPDGTYVDTTVQDVSQFGRSVQWGGIVIERAYLEYDVTDHLTIRAGHWLTPYGIWNIDHGSPVIIPTTRPYIIGEQFFPEHQTGLELFGSHTQQGFKLDYHVTVSNGRGPSEAQEDRDRKLAFGGRLELETPWGVRLGSSYYRGRYTGNPQTAGAMPETYLEAAYGADVLFDRGPLHIQAEAMVRERHYPLGFRTTSGAGFAADGRDLGYYAIIGYRFDQLWNVMPFFYHEDYRPSGHGFFERVDGYSAGLNFRPSASTVFKVMGSYVAIPAGQGLLQDLTLRMYTAQASWVF
ncbi:MAG TPA: hypothetical protein VGD37_03515 [Kofleriaceae bacterium]|jgi:hypothetical protein